MSALGRASHLTSQTPLWTPYGSVITGGPAGPTGTSQQGATGPSGPTGSAGSVSAPGATGATGPYPAPTPLPMTAIGAPPAFVLQPNTPFEIPVVGQPGITPFSMYQISIYGNSGPSAQDYSLSFLFLVDAGNDIVGGGQTFYDSATQVTCLPNPTTQGLTLTYQGISTGSDAAWKYQIYNVNAH